MADDSQAIPEIVPVFPLPEVVLFPHTILRLHIFEPRYRAMMKDALAGPRMISVALLRPGYEPLEFTRHAPIHKTIGVGQIYQSEQVANGNYNLLLRGVGRATIVEELTERDYRLARVTPVQTYCHSSQTQVDQLREELFAAIRGNRALDPDVRRHWLRLAEADLDLDDVCDLIAAGLPVEAELRQCLLDEPEAAARTQMLIDHMRTLAAIARNYWRPMRPDGNSMN
ncbi:MAG TPA: LON peptidase substrate-binding domain-containing protein [Phycisphaerae bacterium]|nr:LON peptidase substrate-binding domain-containing protein [Phycisphaerae bacterium]HQL53118.1 LON peptidase substrate-binding domain-containing protein [Phycisphaerae bacterium]